LLLAWRRIRRHFHELEGNSRDLSAGIQGSDQPIVTPGNLDDSPIMKATASVRLIMARINPCIEVRRLDTEIYSRVGFNHRNCHALVHDKSAVLIPSERKALWPGQAPPKE
jgi:hypothetical protein